MSKNITLNPGHYRDLLNEIWFGKSSRGHSGDTVQCGMGTTLKRKDPHSGDLEEVDVYISFDATLATPGSPQSYDDPGSGHEWEFEITDIELDLGANHGPSDLAAVGGPLTDEEKDKIRVWFEHNAQKADEIANDQYDPSDGAPDY